MYEFDVNYTNEEYMEYYKNVLFTRKIFKNLIMMALLIAIAILWWVDKSNSTKSQFIPIFALVVAAFIPLSSLIYLGIAKRQLKLRQEEVKNVSVGLAFDEEEIIYENKTMPLHVEEEKPQEEAGLVPTQEEEGEYETEEKEPEPQRTFTLHYNNFYEVTATKNLLMMSLDRQTVIIIPKRTIVKGNIEDFIQFLASKIPAHRLKIKGVKSTFTYDEPVVEKTEDPAEEDHKENE